MIIQHNIMALNSYNKLATNNSAVQKNLEKLSSGYRINRAGDDAAGLAISEKMRAQITGLERAKLNAQDGISLVQTAEGALTEVHSMLNRLVELGTESANGIYQATDREKIQAEVQQIGEEIDRISKATNFNGIKLLDGSLASVTNDSITTKNGEVNFADGMEIANTEGKGAQSEFSIQIDKAFGDGDKLTLYYNLPSADGTSNVKSVELTYTDAAIADADYATDDALTFTGDTKEAQMESIMKRLSSANANAAMKDFNPVAGNIFEQQQVDPTAGKYTIGVDGNKLTIKANDEGLSGKLAFQSISSTNVDVRATSADASGKASTAAVAANDTKYTIDNLVTGDTNIAEGDTLKFDFILSGGVKAEVNLKITAEIYDSNHEAMTNKIVQALNNSKFELSSTDVSGTNLDVSQYKVSDFFTLTANKGLNEAGTSKVDEIGSIGIERTAKALAAGFAVANFKIDNVKRSKASSPDTFEAMNTGTGTNKMTIHHEDLTAAVTNNTDKNTTTVTLDRNVTVGDKFVLNGKLADGRSFRVQLTAAETSVPARTEGKDNLFTKGATSTDTATNIAAALKSADMKVDIVDAEGNVIEQIAGDKAFGANGASMMTVGSGAGTLTFQNKNGGVAAQADMATGVISSANVVAAQSATASGQQITAGVDQTAAMTKIEFSDISKLEYGTSITVGSKTFELVASADSELSEAGNIRVVLDSLENASANKIATTFQKAINDELVKDGKITDYAVEMGLASEADKGAAAVTAGAGQNINLATVEAGTNIIEMKTREIGSTVEKLAVGDTYGTKKNTTVDFATNSDGSLKLKAGDTMIVNGKTYQFDTDVRNAKNGNNIIKVDDFSSKEKIANAIKTALNADDPTVDVKINDDFSVTLSGAGKNEAPTVEIGADKGGLTLQIGDTAEDFNKVTVSVADMSTKGLGIYDLKVTDQGLASESIDKVKDAIEKVSVTRGNLGALQNRLEHTINNLATTTENMTAAESRIRDTDMAKEMMNFTKNNVLVQAAQAMLAQANQQPQQVLQLLR